MVTTEAARVSAMTWQIAVELSSTHCHQLLPPTRAEVSSEPMTGLARTASAIVAAAATNGAWARCQWRRESAHTWRVFVAGSRQSLAAIPFLNGHRPPVADC